MLAIIPARGGSKRLKRKNVLPFKGKPMIAWTIEAALASGRFQKIIVSTDDEEIAAVAQKYWISIDRRPEHLATDQARVVDVCIDILMREESAAREWQRMACLYATAPLRTAADIQAVYDLADEGFALAATDYALSPHQALALTSECGGPGATGHRAMPMWPEHVEKRHDEMPALRVDNGSTYICSVPEFLKQRTFYGKPLRVYTMPRERSVDIDTQADLDYAMWLAK